MRTMGKTIAAVGTAAAIGGGVLLYNAVDHINNISTNDVMYSDNIDVVKIETVDIPIVTIDVVKADVVDVHIVKEITSTEIAKLNLPDTAIEVITLENIIIHKPGEDVAEFMKLMVVRNEFVEKNFKDLRNLRSDKTMLPDRDNWKQWHETYKDNTPYTMKYVALPEDIKMIAQVELPKNDTETTTLIENLKFYKKEGYNAVLLVFDGTESLYDLTTMVEYLQGVGFKTWFAFSGPENLEFSVFPEQEKFANYLSELGKICDGFILGWRRTSAHLFIQDKHWYNFVINNVRANNQAIPIIGEAYIGETAITPERTRTVCYNIPENASGVMVNGLGFNGVAVEMALGGTFKECSNYDRLALIVGDKPYYNSMYKTNKSIEENYQIKKKLENRFKEAGCTGTITLHGDGSNGAYGDSSFDNLCKPNQQ